MLRVQAVLEGWVTGGLDVVGTIEMLERDRRIGPGCQNGNWAGYVGAAAYGVLPRAEIRFRQIVWLES